MPPLWGSRPGVRGVTVPLLWGSRPSIRACRVCGPRTSPKATSVSVVSTIRLRMWKYAHGTCRHRQGVRSRCRHGVITVSSRRVAAAGVRCACARSCRVRVQSWCSRGIVVARWGASHRLLEEVDDLRHVAAQLEGELLHAATRAHVSATSDPRQIGRVSYSSRVGLAECRSSGELPYY